MFTNAGEVLKFNGDQKVEFVDVRFCDLPGTVQHFTVPVESFGEKVFTDGLMFDGSSIRGFQQIHESDMLLMPDATTAMLDPFRQHPTLNITFFVHDPLTGEPYSRDPRNIARKAEDFLRGAVVKRRLAGQHLTQDRAQREDIDAFVQPIHFTARLLRGHVRRRTHDGTALRLPRFIELFGQPEIGDLGAAVGGEQDVGRLQVAVDDLGPVSGLHRPS